MNAKNTRPQPLPPPSAPPAGDDHTMAGAMAAAGITHEPPVDPDADLGPDAAGPLPPPDVPAEPMGKGPRPRFGRIPRPGEPDDDARIDPMSLVDKNSLEDDTSDEAIAREIAERWGDRAAQVRVPFGAGGSRLPSAKKRRGFHTHVFNDYPGRIEAALNAGYKHVTDAKGAPISRVVGVSAHGGPLHGYLMEIPEEWYLQDIAAEQRKVDEVDRVILGGGVGKKEGDGRYRAGIEIDQGD